MIPPHLDFRLLKRLVSIEQVLADQGLLAGLRCVGASLVGTCPLHGGDNPSAFVVHRARNLWRCFTVCRTGGDVVDLVLRLHDGGYHHAALYLARLAGSRASSPSAIAPLVATPPVRPFRPFTRSLPLDPNVSFLADKGILPQTALRFEVGAFYGRGMLADCVAVRLHDPEGQPMGYAGRRLDGADRQRGKWVFPPALPRSRLLYGYHRIYTDQRRWGLVVVECPWGVLRLAQLAIPAVALLGTQLSEPQRALLLTLPRVILLLDGDQAGSKAALEIRERLPRVDIVELPDGSDPDDLSDRDLAQSLPLLS